MFRKLGALAFAGMLVGGIVGPTFAASTDEENETTALQGVKLTLSEAIATAEHKTGGKAFDAGVDVKAGSPRIVVETNGPKGVQTVTVDAQNGQVIGIQAGGQPD